MNNLALAPYGLLHPKFKQEPMLELLAKHPRPAISILYNTFGKDLTKLNGFLEIPKPKVLQIHLIWSKHNDGTAPHYEVLHGYDLAQTRKQLNRPNSPLVSRLKKYTERCATILQALPLGGTTLYISPELETGLDADSFRLLASYTMPFFPGAIPVYSPLRGGPLKGFVHELHGPRPNLKAPCIFNLDGVDIHFPFRGTINEKEISLNDLKGYKERSKFADLTFFHFSECNGRKKGFEDPRQRTNFPTKKHWKALEKYYL